MTVPTAIMAASIQINRPRLWERDVSACHTGIEAVFAPLPTPCIQPSSAHISQAQRSIRRRKTYRDYPPNNKLAQLPLPLKRRNLNNRPQNHNNRTHDNRLSPTQPLSKNQRPNRTTKTSDLVDRGYGALDRRMVCVVAIRRRKIGIEVFARDLHKTSASSKLISAVWGVGGWR